MTTLPLIHLEVALCIALAVVLGLIDPVIHLVVRRVHGTNTLGSVILDDLFCLMLMILIPLTLLTKTQLIAI